MIQSTKINQCTILEYDAWPRISCTLHLKVFIFLFIFHPVDALDSLFFLLHKLFLLLVFVLSQSIMIQKVTITRQFFLGLELYRLKFSILSSDIILFDGLPAPIVLNYYCYCFIYFQAYWQPHNRAVARRIQNMGWRADGGLWLLARGGGLYLSKGTGVFISENILRSVFLLDQQSSFSFPLLPSNSG